MDDHALFREGLTYVLDTLSDDVTVIEASNSNSAMKILAETPALYLIWAGLIPRRLRRKVF